MPSERPGRGGSGGGGTATIYWPGAVAADAGNVVQQGGRDQVEIGGCISGLADGLLKLPPIHRLSALRQLDRELAKAESGFRKALDSLDAVRDLLAEYAQQLVLQIGHKDAADDE